jgi:hypothetical protein
MILITFSTISLQRIIYGDEGKYKYDYSNPQSIVNSACLMLMNSDYSEMLNITDLMEKKRTQQTLDAATNAETRDALLKEAGKIISYELVGIEDFTNDVTNQLMVVTVKWTLKIDSKTPIENDPFKAMNGAIGRYQKQESIVFTDYLLKKINDKWKIISKKSK